MSPSRGYVRYDAHYGFVILVNLRRGKHRRLFDFLGTPRGLLISFLNNIQFVEPCRVQHTQKCLGRKVRLLSLTADALIYPKQSPILRPFLRDLHLNLHALYLTCPRLRLINSSTTIPTPQTSPQRSKDLGQTRKVVKYKATFLAASVTS